MKQILLELLLDFIIHISLQVLNEHSKFTHTTQTQFQEQQTQEQTEEETLYTSHLFKLLFL